MNRQELIEADQALLAEIWEAAVLGESLPRNPAWADSYQPLVILADSGAYPEHADVALVNLRIAKYPDEQWSKCADCGRIYLVRKHGETVCSDECFLSYAAYLANPDAY